MAPDIVKAEVAEDADAAFMTKNSAEPKNEAPSASTRPRPFKFAQEWRQALDMVETRQIPQPASAIPTFVFGESSNTATAMPETALSPSFPGAKTSRTAFGSNSSSETYTSQRDKPTKLPSFTFDFGSSTSTESAWLANTPTFRETGPSSITTAYEFGNFRGLHNVTPVPSPKVEPFKVPDDLVFDFSLPSPNCLRPKAALRSRSPRSSRSASMSNLLASPSSTESGRLSTEPGQSSMGDITPLSRNRSHSDLGHSVAGNEPPVVPYNVLNEETPHHPFFSNSFQSSLQRGVRVAKAATDILKSVPSLKELGLDGLLKEAESLSSFQATSTRTIAILGDSGQGKSSLINSLLHIPKLARTGDTGSACTSVVTEYRQKQPNQKDNILIEVEVLSPSEIEDVVMDYLWKYRLFYNADHHIEGLDEEFDKEYRRCEIDALQAWSALSTAFSHHQEFSKQFLQEDSEGALERTKEKLAQWSNEIDWPDGVEESVWRSSAKDAKECFNLTTRFMGDKYWPFTKMIRVYINSQILKTGIVLADLPGLQDTNFARVKATQDYLMKCNTVFIVANISRAITDQSLKSSLFSVLSRHVPLELEESGVKALRVAVICTRVEDIDVENAKQKFCGLGNSIDPDECEKFENDIEDARRSGDSALKKDLKLRYKLLFIEARNQHVKQGLQKAYASKVPNRRLDVFCVSNSIYEKQVSKGNSTFVTASGIPELRRFCHTITADAQLQEATHFLKSSIPGLLVSLEIRLNSLCSKDEKSVTLQQSRKKIQAGLDEMDHKAGSAIYELIDELRSDYVDQIAILFDRNEEWQQAAATQGKAWQQYPPWHWKQYDAWCRNNGNHATDRRDHEDWNAQIIWKMRSELEFQWTVIEDEISTGFSKLQKTLEGLVANLQVILAGLELGDIFSVLESALLAQMHHVTYRVQQVKERYAQEVSLTRRYASETNLTSFILQQMTDTYRHAAEQERAGKSARQKAIVQGRITDGMLFPTICALITDRIDDALERAVMGLLEMRQSIVRHITSDFDCALGEDNSEEGQTPITMESPSLEMLRAALTTVKLLNLEAKALLEPTR